MAQLKRSPGQVQKNTIEKNKWMPSWIFFWAISLNCLFKVIYICNILPGMRLQTAVQFCNTENSNIKWLLVLVFIFIIIIIIIVINIILP